MAVGLPRHKDHNFAFAKSCAGGGRALGVCGGRKKVQLILFQKGGKVGAVQQDGNPDLLQPAAQGFNRLGRGKTAVVTERILGFGPGMRGVNFRHKGSRAKLSAQQ